MRYWLLAMDEHSLQSPFLYELYQKSLNPTLRQPIFDKRIEGLRNKLLNDSRSVEINHLGSGSHLSVRKSRRISAIARSGITSRQQSEILFNLLEYFNCRKVLELGTSLGINTMYMQLPEQVEKVTTVEGNAEIAEVAQSNFETFGQAKISLVASEIDQFFLTSKGQFDLVYMDANHTYDATLRYFSKVLNCIAEDGIIVLDDINWSKAMSKAWNEIRSLYTNHLFIENASIGIVFVNRSQEINHFVLRF